MSDGKVASGGEGPAKAASSDLSGALHDVSNALTVVLGWVAEARDSGATAEERAAALRMIEDHARRAKALARGALGAGSEPAMDERSIDLVVDETLSGMGPVARERAILLVVEGSADLAVVRDAAELGHILTNLLLNAVAHSPEGAHVVVRLEPRGGGEVTIDVSDEGPGVPEPLAARIFEGHSTRAGGAGVGLSHSRAVAERRGGSLVLVRRPGPGALFRLTWPRVDSAPRPSGTRGGVSLAGRSVLLVEDDRDVVALLEAALEARGARVRRVGALAELEPALTIPYDGAVVDLSPLADDLGGALGRIARALPAGAPLVVATGNVDGLPADVAHQGPIVQVVRKPFELVDVLAALAKLA
ncbi:MAG: hybrid sensor histidine kinase/response regulator [Myxococcales bacterium]|nr:hybrid sensor histidine kinase/response regulator [Myxococcales bacterium]